MKLFGKKVNLKPIGRTLIGKNKGGKLLYGAIGSVVGVNLLGDAGIVGESVPVVSAIASLEWLDVATLTGGLVLTLLVSQGALSQLIASEIKDVLEAYAEWKKDPNQENKDRLFDQGVELVEAILDKFGIHVDLDGDGKVG